MGGSSNRKESYFMLVLVDFISKTEHWNFLTFFRFFLMYFWIKRRMKKEAEIKRVTDRLLNGGKK